MKRTLFTITFFGLLLLSSGAFPMSAQSNPSTSAEDLQKRKRAEHVVMHAMQIFGRTLSFNNVYRETFVRDKTVEQNETTLIASRFIDDFGISKDNLKEVSKTISEKDLFIKANTVIWLLLLCTVEKNKWFDFFETAIARKLNRRQRIIYRRFRASEKEHALKSKSEILDALSIIDVSSSVLKNFLTAKFKKDLQNKVTIELFREISPPKDKPYASKYKNFYEITVNVRSKWIPFSFTVVEESGLMKILFVESLLD